MRHYSKRIIFAAVCASALNAGLAAQDWMQEREQTTELWWTADIVFANVIADDAKTGFSYLGAPGVQFKFYSFAPQIPVGFYMSFSYFFPAVEHSTVLDDYKRGPQSFVIPQIETMDYLFGFDILIGPGIRIGLSERWDVHFAPGFNMMMLNAEGKSGGAANDKFKARLSYGAMGLGLDLGFKLNFAKAFYIDFGVLSSVALSGETTGSAESLSSNDSRDYPSISSNTAAFNIKPYIGFGTLTWTQVRSGYGKAPSTKEN